MIDIQKAKDIFLDYVKGYDINNGRIKLKMVHILNVAKNCKEIAENLKLNEEQIKLAYLIGLFHDIGRFEQVRIYNTFSDKDTGLDHGEYSLKVLYDDKLIEKFIDTNKYDDIIKKAVFYHNKAKIADDVKDDALMFSKIIRDADKIDIYRVINEEEMKDIFWYEEFNDLDISEKLMDEFERTHFISYKDIKNNADLILAFYGYVFDFNYEYCLKNISENRYLERFYQRIKDTFKSYNINKKVDKVLDICNNYINEKTNINKYHVQKINHRELPIHGAMVKMTLHNGETKNIVVMGDSGAGKSETIEQIKVIGAAYITDLKTIYDDMGVLSLGDKGKVKTSGTEIGAFVRLDDLDAGYSFKELDRSVFMNPDKVNARIVIPITDYKDVVAKHDVDLFLYANNYDEDGEALSFFDTPEEALEVFRAGNRMAKGTTTEYGLVGSYFANPFGPVQRREQTEPILQDYFKRMFKQGVKVGQLRTRLGIKGNEHQGPKDAAIAILKYVTGEEELKELPVEE